MKPSIMKMKYIAALLVINLQISTSTPAKVNSRPVHEIINEQSRIDEKIRPPANLPYGNPLAGNSKQNARLHAQNQQAMFNAERVRQHRAQLQRWTKAPPQVDSYMKAYHESQENHQLAVEQQQAKGHKVNPVTKATPRARLMTSNVKRSPKSPDITKITKADAVKPEGSRNHRSYGSVEYQQYLQPKRYQTVYVSPAPTYDQGVTIKPNGNVGLAGLKTTEEPKLFTQAVPSKTQYVYPKQYNQMQNYQSAQDIDNLNLLLNKNSKDQLSELSALLKHSADGKDSLETPIDLFFYLKGQPTPALPEHYEQSMYAQIPNYASNYKPLPAKDHTPITEDIDDIEDPNKHMRLKTYGLQSVLATEAPEETVDTTTTSNNHYYKVEVASQSITAPSHAKQASYYSEEKPTYEPQYYLKEEMPTYAALHGHQPSYHNRQEDLSEKYLHHNSQHKGIHHLTGDGTGVSAYGDDNLHYAANYEFGYRVRDHHTGNDFGHHEAKKGEKTNGHYHVLLPDGRMQKVKYSAGPEGFHADISYDHLQ